MPLIDRQARLDNLLRLLAAGYTKAQIIQYVRAKWKLSFRQARRWATLTYRTAAENHANGEPGAVVIEALLREVIQGAIKDRQWSAARATIVDFARFKGFFASGPAGEDQPTHILPTVQINQQFINDASSLRALAPIEKRKMLNDLEARRTQWLQQTSEIPPEPSSDEESSPSPPDPSGNGRAD